MHTARGAGWFGGIQSFQDLSAFLQVQPGCVWTVGSLGFVAIELRPNDMTCKLQIAMPIANGGFRQLRQLNCAGREGIGAAGNAVRVATPGPSTAIEHDLVARARPRYRPLALVAHQSPACVACHPACVACHRPALIVIPKAAGGRWVACPHLLLRSLLKIAQQEVAACQTTAKRPRCTDSLPRRQKCGAPCTGRVDAASPAVFLCETPPVPGAAPGTMRVVRGRRYDAPPPRDEAKASIMRAMDLLRRDIVALDQTSSMATTGASHAADGCGYAALEGRISALAQQLTVLREAGGEFPCRGVPLCTRVVISAEGRLLLCGGERGHCQVFYVADVAKVTPLPRLWEGTPLPAEPAPQQQPADGSLETPSRRSSGSPTEVRLQEFRIELRPRFGSRREVSVDDGAGVPPTTVALELYAPAEFLEVLGAQLGRHNRRKHAQFRRLVALHRQLRISFSPECPAHVDLLHCLWTCVFPSRPPPPIRCDGAATTGSNDNVDGWMAMGFSTAETPQEDLVTTGILALQQACYFARHMPARFRTIAAEAVARRLYPFAPVVVGVTQLLMNMLEMPSVALQDPEGDVWRDDVVMNSVLLSFLYHVPHDEALPQVYCFFLGTTPPPLLFHPINFRLSSAHPPAGVFRHARDFGTNGGVGPDCLLTIVWFSPKSISRRVIFDRHGAVPHFTAPWLATHPCF